MIDNVSSMCFPIGYDLFFSTGGEIFKTGFCGIIYHTVGRLTRGRGGETVVTMRRRSVVVKCQFGRVTACMQGGSTRKV